MNGEKDMPHIYGYFYCTETYGTSRGVYKKTPHFIYTADVFAVIHVNVYSKHLNQL